LEAARRIVAVIGPAKAGKYLLRPHSASFRRQFVDRTQVIGAAIARSPVEISLAVYQQTGQWMPPIHSVVVEAMQSALGPAPAGLG